MTQYYLEYNFMRYNKWFLNVYIKIHIMSQFSNIIIYI